MYYFPNYKKYEYQLVKTAILIKDGNFCYNVYTVRFNSRKVRWIIVRLNNFLVRELIGHLYVSQCSAILIEILYTSGVISLSNVL